jgi:transcriptional regulator with XRE-family HTH domain
MHPGTIKKMAARDKTGKLEKAFAAALRELRTEKELSQEKLALDAGYHRTYVGILERGKQNPTLRTITRLAKVLGVPAAKLVERFEKKLDS